MELNRIDTGVGDSELTKWSSTDFLVLDLEGTGSSKEQRIIEIAAFIVRDGRVQEQGFHRLVNPEIKISPIASSIHGIRDEDVVGMPLLPSIKADLEALFEGKILVAHNAAVERKLLSYNLASLELPQILDTLKLSRALYPEFEKHGLDDLIERLGLKNLFAADVTFKRHRAKYDAFVTAHAFVSMISERLPNTVTIDDLMEIASLSASKEKTRNPDSGSSSSQLELF